MKNIYYNDEIVFEDYGITFNESDFSNVSKEILLECKEKVESI